MMVQIKIERIGDNIRDEVGFYKNLTNHLFPGAGDALFGKKGTIPSRAWVCKIIGEDPKYKFKREFLRPNIDYSQANSVGSRGVFAYYNLENDNVYEVSSPASWKNTDRYFCRIENDAIIYMEKDEVLEWLKSHLE